MTVAQILNNYWCSEDVRDALRNLSDEDLEDIAVKLLLSGIDKQRFV